MYEYNMQIVLGNLNANILKFQDLLTLCKDLYNRNSLFSKNRKQILEMTFEEDNSIKIILTSESKLTQPLKALHLFSRLIIKNATELELKEILYSKKTVLRLLNYSEKEV